MNPKATPFPILGGRPPALKAPAEAARRSASSDFRIIRAGSSDYLFVVDGSQLFEISGTDAGQLTELVESMEADDFARTIGIDPHGRRWVSKTLPELPAVRSISLQVAHSCNMSCHYCYADEGRFGGRAGLMDIGVAKAALDRLIQQSDAGAPLLLGYMGGEPLLNWPLIRDFTPYATKLAATFNHDVRFSITTNGTLLREEQARLFRDYPFAVQLSIDGLPGDHDALRPMKDGTSGYRQTMQALAAMDQTGRPKSLTARATVTPQSGNLLPILDSLIEKGFDDVGFAAVLVSPSPGHAMNTEDLDGFRQQMIACGRKALAEAKAGRRYPFSNFLTAMEEIHRGTHRPYPCGAGAAYLSADSDGSFYACHRLVRDDRFHMGSVSGGLDESSRRAHLARSHVDWQEPCQSCWARYLCGGGCYHEVSRRGRIACDYIRGWLEFCIGAYAELDRPALDLLLGDRHRHGVPATTALGGLLA
jgi:uncharacterized protein